MTWPTGPPPMPPSGWYDDPEHPWTWRYWDGARWTDHRAPMWVPPARDPLSFSAWFERCVVVAKVVARRVGVVLLGVWLLVGVCGWWLVVATFDSARGRELRGLLDLEQRSVVGPTVTAQLTDAEAERAWELVQDIFWSALPWLILLTVGATLLAAWSTAFAAHAVKTITGDPAVPDVPAEPRAHLAGAALRRVPAVIASGLVVFSVIAGIWAVSSLPVALVAVLGGGGVAIVLTVVFVVVLAIVATASLWVRLASASVIAATGGHGIGVAHSWRLTRDQFWYAAGRLIITGLIASAASGVITSVAGFGQFLGFAAYIAIVVVLQAAALAASIVIIVSGQVVTIDQLSERSGLG